MNHLQKLKDQHAALVAQRHELEAQQARARKQAQAGDGRAISNLARLRGEIREATEAAAELAPLIEAAERTAEAAADRARRRTVLAQARKKNAARTELAARIDQRVADLAELVRELDHVDREVQQLVRTGGGEAVRSQAQRLATIGGSSYLETLCFYVQIVVDGRHLRSDLSRFSLAHLSQHRTQHAERLIAELLAELTEHEPDEPAEASPASAA